MNSVQSRKSGGRPPKLMIIKAEFTFTSSLKEDHGLPLFSVQFNNHLNDGTVFATVGSNRASIYDCSGRNRDIQLLHCYADPDPDEVFYTCAWSFNNCLEPLLAIAGLRGVIRIISIKSNKCVKSYVSHGSSINELKFSSANTNLLVSASKDLSLRMWNIKTDVCVAIFGGVGGHRDEVLCVDINATGSWMISSGIDHSLMIWRLDKPDILDAIAKSERYNSKDSFQTLFKMFPDYTTRDIHNNYVDCVKWFGDFVISKSSENEIVCWIPPMSSNSKEAMLVKKFLYSKGNYWFMRFGMDFFQNVLVVGDTDGGITGWNVSISDPSQIKQFRLVRKECDKVIRHISFSKDGNTLIAVSDDSCLWRWDKI